MAADPKRHGLGRGLSALLGDESEDYAALARMRSPRTAGIEQLRPSRFQPRRAIREEDLADLAHSIAEKGVLQPILVRRDPDDPAKLEIIAGERRWRAAQIAQLHEVPVAGPRAQRSRGPGSRADRESAAPGSDAAGRSRRLSPADGGVSALAGRTGESGRQEPQPRRQHDAPAGVARAGEATARCRHADRRPRPRAVDGRGSRRAGPHGGRPGAERPPDRAAGRRAAATCAASRRGRLPRMPIPRPSNATSATCWASPSKSASRAPAAAPSSCTTARSTSSMTSFTG